jgi:hypothetical protein
MTTVTDHRFSIALGSVLLLTAGAVGPALAAPPPGATAASTLKAPPRPLTSLSAVPAPPSAPAPTPGVAANGPSISAGAQGSSSGGSIRNLSVSSASPPPALVFRWSYIPGATEFQVLSGPPGGPYVVVANLNPLLSGPTYTYHPSFAGTTRAFVVRAKFGTDLGGNSNEVIVTWPAP